MRVLATLLLAVIAAYPAAAQINSVELHPPARDFGFFVGDVITTEAVITVAGGTVLQRDSLPAPGPVDSAIELRSVQVTEADLPGQRQFRVQVEYQSFFAPERVMPAELPGYTIAFSNGSGKATAHIPAWTYHVSPLRVAEPISGTPPLLRSDHPMPQIPLGIARLRLISSTILVCLVGLTIAGRWGWLPSRPRPSRPFAAAWHRIRNAAASNDRETAFRALHRAFDATAGHPVLADDVDSFLVSHPRYSPLRSAIAQFFEASRQIFFARDAEKDVAGTTCRLEVLAIQLMHAERRW
jgi:mxaA protein